MSDPGTGAVQQAEQATPEAIMELGFAFWGSKTLLSAVELGVFSELSDAGPLDGDALRERLGLHPRSAAHHVGAGDEDSVAMHDERGAAPLAAAFSRPQPHGALRSGLIPRIGHRARRGNRSSGRFGP